MRGFQRFAWPILTVAVVLAAALAILGGRLGEMLPRGEKKR